jgi:hypothetical protein
MRARCESVKAFAQCTFSTVRITGPRPLGPTDQRHHHVLLAAVTGVVVHGVVDAAQFDRLGQVEQIVHQHPLVRLQPAGGDRILGRLGANRLGATAGQSQQAAHQRADRVLALADAEIEHQALVRRKALRQGQRGELLDQPGLADPRLAAQHDRLAGASLSAGLEHAGELAQLRFAADQAPAGARRRFIGQPARAPHPDRLVQAPDRNLALVFAIDVVEDGALDRLGDQGLASLG